MTARRSVSPRREDRRDGKDNKKDAKARPDGKPAGKPDDKPADAELSPDDAAGADQPPVTVPEKSARSPDGVYEFREQRWVELYNKKLDEMIGVLKSRGVPVLWVGLPAVRGPKATADMLFLNSLYRDAAGKAGIAYVDVWDGFVDEAGRFLQQGPDFEGQIRRLRSYDGVFFTKAGARKLAHYVEREINRLLAARSAPIALPTEPATPDVNATAGSAGAASAGRADTFPWWLPSVGTDQLLGGPGARSVAIDPLAARVLVKGEPLSAPAGRADDFAWPRREVRREQIKSEPPVASVSPRSSAPRGIAEAEKATPPELEPWKSFDGSQNDGPGVCVDAQQLVVSDLLRIIQGPRRRRPLREMGKVA